MSSEIQLSDDERNIIEMIRAGRGFMANVNFGFGVLAEELPDGRIAVKVNEDILCPGYDGPAVRGFMAGIANSWQRQLQGNTKQH